jgi:hypothetical protein
MIMRWISVRAGGRQQTAPSSEAGQALAVSQKPESGLHPGDPPEDEPVDE